MHNSEQKSENHSYAPRISFSNDFAESHYSNKPVKQEMRSLPAASSDFEFSVSSHSTPTMSGADELFSKGKLLPFKENQRTLREELLVDDEANGSDIFRSKPAKSSTRWKGFLGLRKSHVGSKKMEKISEGSQQD